MKTGSGVIIEKYARKTAGRLAVLPEAVLADFKKFSILKVSTTEDEAEVAPAETDVRPPSPHELYLLKLLLLNESLVAWAALHLDVNWISHPVARQIVEQRLAAQTDESWKCLAAFLDACDSAEMRNLVTEAAAEDRKIPNPDQQLADVVLKLRNQFLDRQIAMLTRKASQPELSDIERVALLREQQKLRQRKQAGLSTLGEV